MTQHSQDDLWRDFPKTATEFEARFATEEDCRAYWIEARWGGKPACARCKSTRVWTIREGTTFQCAECRHQTSLTAGTVLEKTHKPLKMWFRAVFEISTRRTGISAKDLQRIMGFGSYKTAWAWLHKLRALVRPEREPLGVDYVLGDHNSRALQTVLEEKHIPFVVVSGYPPVLMRTGRDQRVLRKPVKPDHLCDALIAACKGIR